MAHSVCACIYCSSFEASQPLSQRQSRPMVFALAYTNTHCISVSPTMSDVGARDTRPVQSFGVVLRSPTWLSFLGYMQTRVLTKNNFTLLLICSLDLVSTLLPLYLFCQTV